MADLVPPEAYAEASKAYDRETYGILAARHDKGLRAAVDAVWPLAIAEGRRLEREVCTHHYMLAVRQRETGQTAQQEASDVG